MRLDIRNPICRTTHDTREGNLQAPTRHPLDWRNPEFYDEASLDARAGARVRHLPRLPPLRQPVPGVPDALRPRRQQQDDGGGRRREGGLREGRRPVLSLRPLLHDEVPVRAAASVERGLPAPHAARQGGRVPEGRDAMARPAADEHRPRRQARDDSRRRADGEQGQRHAGGAQGDGKDAGCRRRSGAAAVRRRALSRDGADVGRMAGQGRRAHAGESGDLRDVLRQLQRARHRPRSPADPRAQRSAVPPRRKGSLLRDAEARARRSRIRRRAEGHQHRPAVPRWRAKGTPS